MRHSPVRRVGGLVYRRLAGAPEAIPSPEPGAKPWTAAGPSQHPSLSGSDGGSQVRERARRYLQRRKKGDATRLARLGLAALADGAPKGPLCTTVGVRDGLRVFLVPRRAIPIGQDITWWYNPDPLEGSSGTLHA